MRFTWRLCGAQQIFCAYAHHLSLSAPGRLQPADFDDLFLRAERDRSPHGIFPRNMGLDKTNLGPSRRIKSAA